MDCGIVTSGIYPTTVIEISYLKDISQGIVDMIAERVDSGRLFIVAESYNCSKRL